MLCAVFCMKCAMLAVCSVRCDGSVRCRSVLLLFPYFWSPGLEQSVGAGDRLQAGLEQSAGGNINGTVVLKRDFYGSGTSQTSCLCTYQADGVTKPDRSYQDCHYGNACVGRPTVDSHQPIVD